MPPFTPLQILNVPIHLPTIIEPPFRFKVSFYKLPSHCIPTKWSLYRELIRLAPNSSHVSLIRQRWRRPRHRFCTSPAITIRLIQQEEQWVADYRELKAKSRQCQSTDTHADLSESTKTSCDKSPTTPEYSDPPSEKCAVGPVTQDNPILKPEVFARLSTGAVKRFHQLQIEKNYQQHRLTMEKQAIEEYHTALELNAARFKPIHTPGLLFPSLRNPPLPRLKPQPLHITMPITQRQKTRDRRIVQRKSWQEMAFHMREEHRLEQRLSSDGELGQDGNSDQYVGGILRDLDKAEDRDFTRMNTKFPVEMLQERDRQRRRRPTVLANRKRVRNTAKNMQSLQEIASSSEDRSL